MTHRLTLDHVHAGYGRVEVLRDVSIQVPKGSVVALLGPNGAGKTTTLSVISGTLEARKGKVLLDGRNVTPASAFRRSCLGLTIVPEGRGVFPGLSVADNLDIAVHAARNVDDDWRSTQMSRVLEMFPRLQETATATRRHALRRGTADAGSVACAARETESAPARRDLDGPGTTSRQHLV